MKKNDNTESTMAELIKEQNQNTVLIQQAISNYKKSPLERKSLKYVQKWLQDIDELWTKFQKLDHRLRTDLPEKHSYFEQDLYALIGGKYNKVRAKMMEEIKALQQKEQSQLNAKQNDCASTSTAGRKTEFIKLQKINETVQSMLQQVVNKHEGSSQFHNVKLKTIEQHWKHANTLHDKLWTLSATDYDFDKFIEVEEQISNGIIEIQERISHAAEPSGTTNGANTAANVKLPKIELPKFDGNYLNWHNFHDLFSELVDNTSLPRCQKLLYLKSSLSGEAEGVVKNYSTTAANYDIAWKALKERYDNKRVLINTLLRKLLAQPVLTTESIASLKVLHDTTHECLRSLENLGIRTDQWDPIISYIISQRLHKSTHILWEQSLVDPQALPNLTEFLNFIKLRFQALETMGSKVTQKLPQTHHQVRALGTSISAKGNRIICKGTHKPYNCPAFLKMAPKERLNTIQKFKHCVHCLRAGHVARDCKSSSCTQCNKKHNSLLHLDISSQSEHNQDEVAVAAVKSFSSATVSTSTAVLLSTVCINVTDSTGRQ